MRECLSARAQDPRAGPPHPLLANVSVSVCAQLCVCVRTPCTMNYFCQSLIHARTCTHAHALILQVLVFLWSGCTGICMPLGSSSKHLSWLWGKQGAQRQTWRVFLLTHAYKLAQILCHSLTFIHCSLCTMVCETLWMDVSVTFKEVFLFTQFSWPFCQSPPRPAPNCLTKETCADCHSFYYFIALFAPSGTLTQLIAVSVSVEIGLQFLIRINVDYLVVGQIYSLYTLHERAFCMSR